MSAYGMRISYWSSDVFSSDLNRRADSSLATDASRNLAKAPSTSRPSLISHRNEPSLQCQTNRPPGKGSQDSPLPTPISVSRRHAILDDAKWYAAIPVRSEEHTSELQSLMRISYAVLCLKKKIQTQKITLEYYTPLQ